MSFTNLPGLLLCAMAVAIPGFSDTQFAERDPPYRLQASDSVEVRFHYTPEYNTTVAVQPDGYVNLQLIGDVKVSGLTLREAEAAVVVKASVRLNQPEVTILLKDFVKPYYTVAGEVARPGRFEMRGGVSAIEAIAISGGFKESSKHSQVILVRKVNKEMGEVTVIDMKAMSKAGGIGEDIQLRPGDMLIVPQNLVSKLERFVRWSSVGLLAVGLMH